MYQIISITTTYPTKLHSLLALFYSFSWPILAPFLKKSFANFCCFYLLWPITAHMKVRDYFFFSFHFFPHFFCLHFALLIGTLKRYACYAWHRHTTQVKSMVLPIHSELICSFVQTFDCYSTTDKNTIWSFN